jgi:hypothetical protein
MPEDRKSIISSVQTPLGLFALVVLVGEAILVAIAVRATDQNVTILISGTLLILFSLDISRVVRSGTGNQVRVPWDSQLTRARRFGRSADAAECGRWV